MEKMVAFCGIDCAECPTFLATQENNNEKRKKVAEQWSKEYKAQFKPEDINCDGCLQDKGRLFSHCAVCEIRTCGRKKKLVNCAYCNEYPCQKVNNFFMMVPQGKITLDEIRKII
jgi:Protein of unknown function (DUF3795)